MRNTMEPSSDRRPKLVGNFIRQRREMMKLSQRSLGLLFDPPVTTQFISNVERGVTPLPPAHIPTLTKVLQIREGEMMALLEKEYTLKLSGRMGTADGAALHSGDAAIPLDSSSQEVMPLTVFAADFAFIHELYNAYRTAEAKNREAFQNACENILNISRNANGTSANGSNSNNHSSQGSHSQTPDISVELRSQAP